MTDKVPEGHSDGAIPDGGPSAPRAAPANGIALRFWGVRGTLATPGPATLRYGGNTLCVEVRCGSHLLILDGGSGIRPFGVSLAVTGTAVDADILLSHTHLDHICGVPFFAPMFDRRSRVRFWGGHLRTPGGIAEAMRPTWRAPLMPDLDAAFRATIGFRDFSAGDTLNPRRGLRVKTVALMHPGGSIGYRIEWRGTSLCYITDTEPPAGGLDENLRRFVSGTDVMICDASFTDEEYPSRVGWGHSTWRMAADLADAANVGRLVLFHHDPAHDDAMMDEIAREVAARRPGSLVAMEGMRLTV